MCRTVSELAFDAVTIASWVGLTRIVGMPVSEEEMLVLNEYIGGVCTHLHGVPICATVQDLNEALVRHNLRFD